MNYYLSFAIAFVFLQFPLFVKAGETPRPLRLRFEGKAGTSLAGKPVVVTGSDDVTAKAIVKGQGQLTLSEEVSGPFLYDPVTGKSAPNQTSLHLQPGSGQAQVTVSVPEFAKSGSFTLELFVRPQAKFGRDSALAVLEEEGTKSQAGLVTDRQNNYTWLAAQVNAPDNTRHRWNVGYYLGSGQLTQSEYWRHVALVYNAKTKITTFWLDHFQTSSKDPLPTGLTFKNGVLTIGGQFAGHIDEVRLSFDALPRTKFLRMRDTPAEKVHFKTDVLVYPRDAGYIDFKEAFGAVGDGKTDDTRAFREAFRHLANKVPLRNYVLYVPPGEYLISDEIRWTRFLFVKGAGRDKTVIRLKDNCPGYNDPKTPKGVLTVGWHDFTPNATGRAGNNIGSYLHDLTIHTGKGNPAAVALEYHSNNHGSVMNVTIKSTDGQGWAGLSFADNWPGPSLIKNVTVQGFDKGVYSIVGQYSLTFKNLTLENQNEVGIYNRGQMLWIDGLVSNNQVPVMDCQGIVVLVNGRFSGGKEGAAIRLEGGYGLYRNLSVDGYPIAIERKDNQGQTELLKADVVKEKVFGRMSSMFDSPTQTLNLSMQSAPERSWDAANTWTNLLTYADKVKDGDWAPALQAAVDASSGTVYVPGGKTLPVKSPVYVRGKVHHLIGLNSGIVAHKNYDGPVLVYDHADAKHVLIVDRFRADRLHHASPGTLVIRDCSPQYTNKPGAGKLFAENTEGKFEITKQSAWFWQLNPEGDTPAGSAKLENHGGTVVVVGMKTEKKGSNILTDKGGRTELLGGYFYPNAGTGGQPSIIIDNASFSGTWRNYWARYDPVVRETRGDKTRGGGQRYQGLYSGYRK